MKLNLESVRSQSRHQNERVHHAVILYVQFTFTQNMNAFNERSGTTLCLTSYIGLNSKPIVLSQVK